MYKYLGVTFSSSGSFVQCIKYLVSQANRAMFAFFSRINNLDLPMDLQLKLSDHTILPILIYGCLQKMANVRKVHQNTCCTPNFGDMQSRLLSNQEWSHSGIEL
jgi:hypothetical protein